MTKSSRFEAISTITGKLERMSGTVSTEGLFIKDPSTDLFHLIPWGDFSLIQLNQLKVGLRRGDNFTIGERQYINHEQELIRTIGVAFASPEFLFEYGLEMDGQGIISQIKK